MAAGWNRGLTKETSSSVARHGQKLSLKNEEVFIENSTYARHHIKARIIQQKLIKYECTECLLSDSWNEKRLVLHLDHRNGIGNDNRLENLRFLCPNCHSQTETYSRGQGIKNTKNRKKHRSVA